MNTHTKPKIPSRRALKRRAGGVSNGVYLSSKPPGEERWNRYELILRTILLEYARTPEVVNPVRDAEGNLVLDSFGREKETPKTPRPLRSKVGAVWFTKDAMRDAWLKVTGQTYYKEMQPEKFEVAIPYDDPETTRALLEGHTEFFDPRRKKQQKAWRAPIERSYSHPMDRQVERWKKRGDLICDGHNRYFFSKGVCESVELGHLWTLHCDRALKWEGITYRDVEVASTDRRLGPVGQHIHSDKPSVTIQEVDTRRGKFRSYEHMMWNDVFKRLESYVLFNQDTLFRIAVEAGILTEADRGSARAVAHITIWQEKKWIIKKFPRYYQSKDFQIWDENRAKGERAKTPRWDEWMIAFAHNWAVTQQGRPEAVEGLSFTRNTIIGFINRQPAATISRWFPDGINERTITERIRSWRIAGHITFAGTSARRFRLSGTTMAIFEPLLRSEASKYQLSEARVQQRREYLDSLSLDEAVDALKPTDRSDVVLPFYNRIIRITDDPPRRDTLFRMFLRRMNWTNEFLNEVVDDYYEKRFSKDYD